MPAGKPEARGASVAINSLLMLNISFNTEESKTAKSAAGTLAMRRVLANQRCLARKQRSSIGICADGQHLSSHISLDGSSSLKTELNAPMTATLQQDALYFRHNHEGASLKLLEYTAAAQLLNQQSDPFLLPELNVLPSAVPTYTMSPAIPAASRSRR